MMGHFKLLNQKRCERGLIKQSAYPLTSDTYPEKEDVYPK